jgi:hypothetical protein
MRDDLLEAQAGIDWANAQLPILEARIESWRKSTPYKIVEEMHPHNGEKVYKLAEVRQLPAIINLEAGLVINSLRSSLDVLTNILAKRNGALDPTDTQFPICRTRDAFFHGKHAGHKEIKRLSVADRKVIEQLEPWAGGHPQLFYLHTLDTLRKHRRLLGVFVHPVGLTLGNVERKSGFRIASAWKGFQNESIVGWAKIEAPKPYVEITLDVTLAEGQRFPSVPILCILDEFTRSVEAVVNLFDAP